MVAEKWQMGDFSQNLAPRRSRRWPRWLSHRNGEAAACVVTTAKTSAPTVAHFATPARIPPRNRAESPKPYRKPCEESLERRITVRISIWLARMQRLFYAIHVGAHQLGATLAFGNVSAKTGSNGSPPRPHETLAQTPRAEETRYAAPVGRLSGRIIGRQRNGNRGCLSSLAHVWANV